MCVYLWAHFELCIYCQLPQASEGKRQRVRQMAQKEAVCLERILDLIWLSFADDLPTNLLPSLQAGGYGRQGQQSAAILKASNDLHLDQDIGLQPALDHCRHLWIEHLVMGKSMLHDNGRVPDAEHNLRDVDVLGEEEHS